MITPIDPGILHISRAVHGLCRLPYHGHPRGCPNFNYKSTCPPGQPLLSEVFDFNSGLYVIYTAYKVGEFAERMRVRHPEWNNRQCYNPRYWQGIARRLHRGEEENALASTGIDMVTDSPEAYGVDVDHMMKQIGIRLIWGWPPEHSPDNVTYRVSIGGHRRTL